MSNELKLPSGVGIVKDDLIANTCNVMVGDGNGKAEYMLSLIEDDEINEDVI